MPILHTATGFRPISPKNVSSFGIHPECQTKTHFHFLVSPSTGVHVGYRGLISYLEYKSTELSMHENRECVSPMTAGALSAAKKAPVALLASCFPRCVLSYCFLIIFWDIDCSFNMLFAKLFATVRIYINYSLVKSVMSLQFDKKWYAIQKYVIQENMSTTNIPGNLKFFLKVAIVPIWVLRF